MDINSEKFKETLTKAVFHDITQNRSNGMSRATRVYPNALLEKDQVICSPAMWHKLVVLLGRDE